jgi:small-conductance mechanosensitive channel
VRSLPAQAQEPAAKSKTADRTSVPVIFEGETIAIATGRVGAFSPSERAVAIRQRLEYVAAHWEFDPTTITIVANDDDSGDDIFLGPRLIMEVTKADAAAAGKPRRALAEEYALRFRTAIEQARDRHSIRWVLLGGLKAVAATVALLVSLALLRALRRRAVWSLDDVLQQGGRNESIVGVLGHTLGVLLSLLLKLLAWPVVGILLLTYLHYVLHFFPATAPLATSLHESVFRVLRVALERFVTYLPNLVVIALIVLATRFLLKVVAIVLEGFEQGRLRLSGFYPDWARPTYKLLRFVILALTVVVLYPYLPGSDSAAFRGVSVFLGLLLSLGSSSVIANAMAGTIQTYMRASQTGDFVQIGEQTGTVIDKTLLVTRIRTVKNVVITIPNSTTLTTPVRNFSAKAREEGVILFTYVSVPHDVPWRTVHALLLAAAGDAALAGVLGEPRPFINQTALNETHVRYELNIYTDQPARQAAIFTALHQNIQDRFREAGVGFLVPSYVTLLGGDSARIAAAASSPPVRDGAAPVG